MLLFPPALLESVPADPVRVRRQGEDFDQAWSFLQARYAWPERIEWASLKAEFRPRALGAENETAFLRVMEDLLDQFGDAHTHLGANFGDSWWLPPADMVGEWEGKEATITQVQRGSAAWKAGVRPGMRILGFNGDSLEKSMAGRRPRHLAQESADVNRWTLNSMLAGRRQAPRRLKLHSGGKVLDFELPPAVMPESKDEPARLLVGDIGYLGFSHFEDNAQSQRMDAAMDAFPKARAWILDVRNNSGGDTAVIRRIMGRFLKAKSCYAWMARREGMALGPLWAEYVKPQGKTFEGQVAVLVDGSTMSVAEGLAMGIQGLGRGVAVGASMAGLGAAVHSVNLKNTKVRVQISTEPVFDSQKRPRNAFQPLVQVDLSSPENLAKDDPILEAALAMLQSVPATR